MVAVGSEAEVPPPPPPLKKLPYAAREAMRRWSQCGSLVALCGDGALEPRHGPLVDLSEVAQLHAQAQLVEAHLVGRASRASRVSRVRRVSVVRKAKVVAQVRRTTARAIADSIHSGLLPKTPPPRKVSTASPLPCPSAWSSAAHSSTAS